MARPFCITPKTDLFLFVFFRVGGAKRLAPGHIHQYGRTYENRGVGTGDHTDQHRESESPCYFATKDEQDQQGEEYRQ